MRSLAIVAALVVLAVPAVADARLTIKQRSAKATRLVVSASVRLLHEQHRVAADGQRRVQAVRDRAGACSEAIGAIPLARRKAVSDFYFVARSGGLWAVDQPLFERFIGPHLRRPARLSRTWRRTQEQLAAQLEQARSIYGLAVLDICPAVREWRARGFAQDSPPEPIAALQRAYAALESAPDTRGASAKADRLLLRYGGRRRDAVHDVLSSGVDEPDALIEDPDDPVERLLSGDELLRAR